MELQKGVLKEELMAILRRDLEAVELAQRATMEGATHAEAKPENDKDTRALELSYLARGQAMRVEELLRAVSETHGMSTRRYGPQEPIGLGALVTVEPEDGPARRLLLAPHGGGLKLRGEVQVVTLKSPLGEALLGRTAGETAEALLGGKMREFSILSVV